MTAAVRSKAWHGYRWLTPLLATVVCIALGFLLADLGESAAILAASNLWLWFVAVGLSVLMAVLRALRLVTIARPAAAWPIVKASLLHNAANAVLPAKLGEAALPLALARYAGFDIAHGIGLLLMVRLCDLAVLVGLGLLLLAGLDVLQLPAIARFAAAAAGVALCLSVVVLPRLAKLGGRWAGRSVSGLAQRVAEAADKLTGGSRVGLVSSTFAIWLALLICGQASVAAVGLQADTMLLALACVAASLAFALPIGGFANVGPFEAAFAGVLVTGGAPAEQALAAAVLLHLCALAGAMLPAAMALVFPAGGREAVRWS